MVDLNSTEPKKHSMTGKALNENLTWARTMLLVLVVHSSPTKLYRLRKTQALCLKSTDSFFFKKGNLPMTTECTVPIDVPVLNSQM
jgi:hypothetical protein